VIWLEIWATYGESSNEREIASMQRETNYNRDYANQLWLFMIVEKKHCDEQNILHPGRAITVQIYL